jgi:Flp pilus assembly protein TadG
MVGLSNFRRDEGGGAAVEFGLVAPILALMLLAISQGAIMAIQFHDMRGAVHSGAQYVMGGGRDPVAIKAVASSAWTRKPSVASVDIAQSCKCGDAANSCTTLCAGKVQPRMFISVKANATFDASVWKSPVTVEERVRVR